MTYRTATIDDVAKAICELTYSDLMAIAVALKDMLGDSERNMGDENDWAELLNSWAEANFPEESN